MTTDKQFVVYIMASGLGGTLYVGVTSDLRKRVWEHRNHLVAGFTRRYDVSHLVWFEPQPDAPSAIVREKRIKAWRRAWKIALIEKTNPYWHDRFDDLTF